MQILPKAIIIRHRKENLKKCSLRGLEGREDMQFLTYPFEQLPIPPETLMLVMEGAPVLSQADSARPLLILDSTWRYLPKMVQAVEKSATLEKRVLPGHFRTAYPRSQDDCVDPTRGLSSLEALFIAFQLMGHSTEGLLDNYYWRQKFLDLNNLKY